MSNLHPNPISNILTMYEPFEWPYLRNEILHYQCRKSNFRYRNQLRNYRHRKKRFGVDRNTTLYLRKLKNKRRYYVWLKVSKVAQRD